jgi:hypothetical protein
VHPPETRRLNAPILRTSTSAETFVMDDLDEDGKRKGWKSEL